MYLQLIHANRAEARVQILAYYCMTNHVHLVAVPERQWEFRAAERR